MEDLNDDRDRTKHFRPGPGWKHVGGSVYEHADGIRIHVMGLARIAGQILNGREWPESRTLDRYIAINGGNRRRGVMTWATHFLTIGQNILEEEK